MQKVCLALKNLAEWIPKTETGQTVSGGSASGVTLLFPLFPSRPRVSDLAAVLSVSCRWFVPQGCGSGVQCIQSGHGSVWDGRFQTDSAH